jgi:hypothetical protein
LVIPSITGLLKGLKLIIDIATGARKTSEDEFDKSLGTLFTELDSVAKSYFDIFANLLAGIRASKDRKSLVEAMDIALTQRSKMIMNRNKIAGSIQAYYDMLSDTRPFRSPPQDLWSFLNEVRNFFFGPFAPEGSSELTGLMDALQEIQRKDRSDFPEAKRASIEQVKSSMKDLENHWKAACSSFELLRANKSQVLRSLR